MRVKYVLSEVLVGLWRNVTMSIAMIITMAVSLTMLGASGLMYRQVDDMKDLYYKNIQVSIFLKQDVSEQQRTDLDGRLKGDPGEGGPLRRQGRGVRALQGDVPGRAGPGERGEAGPAARVVPDHAQQP
ncbi:hypothetical protein GCM10027614_36390 [Micromonospora vulcania]